MPLKFSSPLSYAAIVDALTSVLDLIENPVLVKDRQHQFVLINQAACDLLGRGRQEVIGRTDHDILPSEQADAYVANDRLVFETGRSNQNEELLTDRAGNLRNLVTRKSLLRLAAEDLVFVCIRDITEFRRAEAQVLHGTAHDGMTGLTNAVQFRHELTQLLSHTRPEGEKTALFLVDLDRFRNLNYALGRSAGDNLLVQFSQFLSRIVQPGDLLARVGGDEFALAHSRPGQPNAAKAVAAAILKRLEAPLILGTRQMHLSATIGIAVAGPGDDCEALLRRAELALRQAKRAGGNRQSFFEPGMGPRKASGPYLEDDLRVALAEEQFSVMYQPIVQVSDLEILGYEALIRWAHPVLGQIGPSFFIPLAESEGFIVAIGEWVLRKACAQASLTSQRLTVSVNVSPIQFTRSDLVTLVRSILKETGIDPTRVELEITETAVIGDVELARRIFADLHEIGVRVVLDDFGAGYSSLEVLKTLPFDKLKIDRSLLRDVGHTEQADAIIGAVLRMSRALGLQVVAEGVETVEQLALLRRENCAALQGFLFGHPVENPFSPTRRVLIHVSGNPGQN